MLTGSTAKAVNVPAGNVPEVDGNWKVLEHCQDVIDGQTSSLELLSTIASYGLARNNSLRFSEDEKGRLVSATLCQCLPDPPDSPDLTEVTLSLVKDDNDWSPQWSAWQYDKCNTITLTNGTSIECGECGSKTRKRLKDLNMEVWEEEVEEVACLSCESYNENWSTEWSAWQLYKCETISLSNGASVECGDRGRKTRKRLKDPGMGVWREELEEVACRHCGCFNYNYKELNSPTRNFANAQTTFCDKKFNVIGKVQDGTA